MYGGVSLAIYIYGVTQELFRAVRGRGLYKLLKTLTDSDIVVDVISGTSAGGINGILLGYALCNNRDISSTSTLWRVDGDIRRMLRSPRDSIAQSTSLLNSVPCYQSRLETAFRDMASYAPEEGEDPSAFPELDLFVTGTDVDGRLYTQPCSPP
jgi:predicted acylesterase/phospholipase RssA